MSLKYDLYFFVYSSMESNHLAPCTLFDKAGTNAFKYRELFQSIIYVLLYLTL